jgi:hypothetical protein
VLAALTLLRRDELEPVAAPAQEPVPAPA